MASYAHWGIVLVAGMVSSRFEPDTARSSHRGEDDSPTSCCRGLDIVGGNIQLTYDRDAYNVKTTQTSLMFRSLCQFEQYRYRLLTMLRPQNLGVQTSIMTEQ